MESARTGRGDVTREEWRRIKAVAAGALEQPEDTRPDYLAAFFNVINWKEVAARYGKATA